MTLDRYSHLFTDDLEALAERLDTAMAMANTSYPRPRLSETVVELTACWNPQLAQAHIVGALGRIRTCDTRFRKPVLYPLSYEGGIGWECG